MESLATVAKALNRGDRSLAAIMLMQAEWPPLSKNDADVNDEPRLRSLPHAPCLITA
jgi:hypothetical protein